MQQGNLAALLTKLMGAVNDTTATGEEVIQGLRADIAPLLSANIKTAVTQPLVAATAHETATPRIMALRTAGDSPAAAGLIQQVPAALHALRAPLGAPAQQQQQAADGISILHSFSLHNVNETLSKWFHVLYTTEFISVYLASDTTHPILFLPVEVGGIIIFVKDTSFSIPKGSVWIRSNIFDASAPAGTYTGLTVSGGTLSFDQKIPLKNKAITMPAGATCTVKLDLLQPVDSSVSPDNTGIDAKNANVQLPAEFTFNFSTPAAKITNVATASWELYGSANTFQYDPAQSPVYVPALSSILIPLKVSPAMFTVSNCGSPFFTLQGSAHILDGAWELPVATVDITNPGTATGAGALAAICGKGLQAKWNGLQGGWIDLKFPLISAAPGLAGIIDFFAGNLYAKQNFNLWTNETTGLFSTLNTMYSAFFPLYYLTMQEGAELLGTVAAFMANIDRPVRVDNSPVEVKGTTAAMFQTYTPHNKYVILYDLNLLQENYGSPGKPVTKVPPEAMALTNALLTVTPATGALLFGQLATEDTFKHAYLFLSFGLFYLIPSLPDPYASTFTKINRRGISDTGKALAGKDHTMPLDVIHELLIGLVRWPVVTNPPTPPPAEVARVAFAIVPINNPLAAVAPADSLKMPAAAAPQMVESAAPADPESRWKNSIGRFNGYDLAMLDVSTNADLMGVSFSTMNIEATSVEKKYTVVPVDNSGEADMLQIVGMDLSTPGKFIRAFTVPEITWEPTINLTPPAVKSGPQDPPLGWLLFGNDGGPTQIFNNSSDVVAIKPVDVSNFIVNTYNDNKNHDPSLVTASIFTLPFGMRSFAVFRNAGSFPSGYVAAGLNITPQVFDLTPAGPGNPPKTATSGLQIIATGKNDPADKSGSSFEGFTLQLRNLLDTFGTPTDSSILGPSVDIIFNDQFQPTSAVRTDGVPLERIDFSGYGASTFSNWIDPTASIAATSQAKFDVFVGRTSLEIIQVKSIVYPWCIHVVRTITMYRAGSALIYRTDSGWRAETDGLYDFSFKDKGGTKLPNPYTFHPGVVKGVFDVKNIIENDLPIFNATWHIASGNYIDDDGFWSPVPSGGVNQSVILQPVYFDAGVQIDDVVQGATKGKVPSKKMVGYVQLSPRGEPISPDLFAQLLNSQSGSLGGPVDCIVNVGKSGQQMRLTSVDVSASVDGSGSKPVFAGTARGTVILPKDGSWSIVQHHQGTDAVSSINNNAAVPLVRDGELKPDGSSDYPANQIRLANPIDLLRAPVATTINYGLLQNTGTQKVLYQLPAYVHGVTQLLSKGNNHPLAKFADAYHLLNSTGIFPNPADIPDMHMADYAINIAEQGYKLINNLNPGELLKQKLPSPFYFVNTPDVKLYIEYDVSTPNLNYDLDSVAKQWTASTKNITLNVDLGPFTKLVYITGNFDSTSGVDTAFNTPVMEFGPDLKPIVEILEVLEDLSGGNYADIAKKAMSIAMGNDGDNYEYKFHADKEIPVVQFPPAELDGPTTPLRLKAGLKVGAYFNESIALTTDISSLMPSAGAYLEFDGSIEVMCVSVGVGTIYAIGQVMLKMSADIKTGPALDMKFGFGAEIMVGLPVVGNASVTIMAGVEMLLSSSEIKITAFLSFKGNADLLGGLVNITIYIEASGTIDKKGGETDMIAEVTFAIDISIFLIINIDFSTSWSETKQVA